MGTIDEIVNGIINETVKAAKTTGEIVGDAINEAMEGYYSKAKRYSFSLKEFKAFSKETPLIMGNGNVAFVIRFDKALRTVYISDSVGKPVAEVIIDKRKMFDSARNSYIKIYENGFCFDIDWSKNGLMYMVEDFNIMSTKQRRITVNNCGTEVIELIRRSSRIVINVSEERFVPLAVTLAVAMMIQRKKG